MENNETNEKVENQTQNDSLLTIQKKRIRKRIGLIILALVLAILTAVGSVVAYTVFLHEPDTGANDPPPFSTEGLNTPVTEPETMPETKLPEQTEEETEAPETEAETQPIDPSQIPKSEQKIYNFLFVGQDRVALNTDVIMLISFNTTLDTINVIQIPRDTYIGISTYSGKINGLYASFYLGNGYKTKEALRSFADTLEQSLCIKIHNVGLINLNGVIAIVDAIGGVDVNIPATVTIYYNEKPTPVTLPAGKQHLTGELAEGFIRHRSSYLQADIGRMDAQKAFVSGFIQKLKTSFNISTVTKFVDIAMKHVTTDVALADAVFYAKELLDVDMSNIKLMSMVGNGATGDGLSYWVMIRKNMCEMINTYFNIYDFEITDGIFDPQRIFSGANRYPGFNSIYSRQDISTNDPSSAGDINDSSIYIPHF